MAAKVIVVTRLLYPDLGMAFKRDEAQLTGFFRPWLTFN